MGFGFPLDFLYDLDVIAFDRLLALAAEDQKRRLLDQAIAVRFAMGADQKEWKTYVDTLSMPPEELEKKKAKETRAGLSRMFGT